MLNLALLPQGLVLTSLKLDYQEAFARALEAASDDAVERYTRIGNKLLFIDDSVVKTEAAWLYDTGLRYKKVKGL